MKADYPMLPSTRWFLIEWPAHDSQIPSAESLSRAFTLEITLFVTFASFLGIAMVGMTILWINWLFLRFGSCPGGC